MSVTHMSRRDSRVTHTWCHKGCHTTPTRPDPTRPISVVTAACGVSIKACIRRQGRSGDLTAATMHALREIGGKS